MTIHVTDHAVERFAERVIGIDPESLTAHERSTIRSAISTAVLDPGANVKTWTVHRRNATYVIDNRIVKTVLLPSHKPRRQMINRARERARA